MPSLKSILKDITMAIALTATLSAGSASASYVKPENSAATAVVGKESSYLIKAKEALEQARIAAYVKKDAENALYWVLVAKGNIANIKSDKFFAAARRIDDKLEKIQKTINNIEKELKVKIVEDED